jgi:hypothetical protein
MKPISVGELTGAVTLLIGLGAIWLYLAGWTYAYAYFRGFNVPSMMVDLSREEIFLYGALTFWKKIGYSLPILALLILLIVLGVRFAGPLTPSKIIGVSVAALMILFGLARLAGTETAASDSVYQRKHDFPAYPRVEIELIEGAKTASNGPTMQIVRSGCARLFLVSDDRIFLIRPVRDAPQLALSTFVLPWSDIATLRINDNYTSCD